MRQQDFRMFVRDAENLQARFSRTANPCSQLSTVLALTVDDSGKASLSDLIGLPDGANLPGTQGLGR